MRNFRWLAKSWPAWIALALFVFTSDACAATATVKDDGGFFSAAAVQKATSELQSLQQQYHHTVVFETAATAPADIQSRIADPTARDQAYIDYSDVRMASVGADIYVFATKSPGHLVVRSKNSEQRSGLTETGRQGLTNEMLAGFKAGQFDQALAKMTDGLRQTFANDANATPSRGPMPGPAAGPQGLPPMNPNPVGGVSGPGIFGSLGCIGLVILLVVVFVVIRLIRRLFGGGGRGYPPAGYGSGYGQTPGGYGGGYPSAGGGGGFGRGIFGGLLGGLFGSYLGNRTFGQGPTQNPGGGLFGGGDSGSSASGGDFGAAPPSNDVGGGGGDFGGGGGDSGSGASGGDF